MLGLRETQKKERLNLLDQVLVRELGVGEWEEKLPVLRKVKV